MTSLMTPPALAAHHQPRHRRPVTGLSALLLAIGFNVPFARLAQVFDYPDILREPAREVLTAFAAGGDGLILTWYAFFLSALALIALAPFLAVTPRRLETNPAMAIGAAISGALAGLAQAIGLSRWVFVVPHLAEPRDGNDGETAEAVREFLFEVLNDYGGVAIGEHLGQLLTALFLAQLSRLQAGEHQKLSSATGGAAALAITAGTGEGLALVLGWPAEPFGLATIAGFALLTLWLVLTGISCLRGRAG